MSVSRRFLEDRNVAYPYFSRVSNGSNRPIEYNVNVLYGYLFTYLSASRFTRGVSSLRCSHVFLLTETGTCPTVIRVYESCK